jgi:Domain of unknown function (DUF4173)
MDNQKIKNILVLIGLFVFHLLFWKEGQGLNLVFFSLFSVATLTLTGVKRWKSVPFAVTAIGTFVLSIFVVWNHSLVSIISFWLSWLTMIGFAWETKLYYLFYALMQGGENVLTGTKNIGQLFKWESPMNEEGFVPEKTSGLRPSLFFIPLSIVLVFVILYMIGNQDFAKSIGDFFAAIFRNLDWLWDLLSFKWLLFLLVGIFVIGGLVWKGSGNSWLVAQMKHIFNIQPTDSIPNMTQINDRYWTVFLTLAMLNALILMVNVQDFWKISQIQNVEAGTLRYSVHIGTFVLIFSIGIAMGLLFNYFRSELNFIEKAPTLRFLAYSWIVQNAIMVIAVAMRNYLYISHYGLAYKRIGVIFFLLLVLFGLYTMFLKIKDQRTFTYLFHLNTWAVYGSFMVISMVNWDTFITNYNLHNGDSDKLDAGFLLQEVSDKNLKILYENRSLLPEKIVHHSEGFFYNSSEERYTSTLLDQKKAAFEEKIKDNQSFFSWNYPDQVNKDFFSK